MSRAEKQAFGPVTVCHSIILTKLNRTVRFSEPSDWVSDTTIEVALNLLRDSAAATEDAELDVLVVGSVWSYWRSSTAFFESMIYCFGVQFRVGRTEASDSCRLKC